MSDPAEAAATAPRLLRLVALFPRSPSWTAQALAAELGVTCRTVRRDVARLRALGYPVRTSFGPGGGYTMTAGVALPPLMLEADEAVAVLLSLQEAAAGTTHAADAALSALEKLRQVMPARLRSDTEALTRHSSELRLGRMIGREPRFVDVAVLVLLARACRQRRRVRERADDASGHGGERILEPLHLVRTMGHWYLVAYVLDDHAWRPLRVDHLGHLTTSTAPSTYGSYDGEVADLVAAHVQAQIQSVTGVVRVQAPAAAVATWIEPAWGRLVAESPTTTIVEGGADSYAAMARWLSLVDAEITVLEPDKLRQAFAELAERAARAASQDLVNRRQSGSSAGPKPGPEPTAADPCHTRSPRQNAPLCTRSCRSHRLATPAQIGDARLIRFEADHAGRHWAAADPSPVVLGSLAQIG